MKTLRITLTLTLTALFAFGCDEIDEAFDCQDLCKELKACDNSALDVSVCEDRCFDRAEDNSTFRRELDDCAACLDKDNLACAEVPNMCPVCVTTANELFKPMSTTDAGMDAAPDA